MAFGTKYQIPFTSPLGVTGNVYLKKEDYTGSVTTLGTTGVGIELEYMPPDDWFDPVRGLSITLSLFNDGSTLFSYEDLMELDEREFQIVVEATDTDSTTRTLFDGWINSDIIEQKYMLNTDLHLSGSNYIRNLEFTHDPSVDTIFKSSLIDILNHTLCLTGKTDNIYVNNRLCPSIGSYPSNKTALNLAGVDTELFWEDNINRMNGLETIETILRSLDCQYYWCDGAHFFERYADLWQENKVFFKYEPNVSYTYNSTCTSIGLSDQSTDICSLDRINRSETRDNIPGYNEIKVTANQKRYLSHIQNDFENTAEFDDSFHPSTRPSPEYRQWMKYVRTTPLEQASGGSRNVEWAYYPVNNYKGISNGTRIGIYNSQFYRLDLDDYDHLKSLLYRGVSYRFNLTVDDASTVASDLKVEFSMVNMNPSSSTKPSNADLESYACHYYIREHNTGNYIVYGYDGHEFWEISNFPDQESATMEIIVNKESLNQETTLGKYEFTIPLADVSGMTNGDKEYIVNIGVPTYKQSGDTYGRLMTQCAVGDFKAVVSGSEDPNITRVVLPTKTLNKKEVDVDMFDNTSYNYRNSLFTDSSYGIRTEYWTDQDETIYQSLTKWMLYNKCQLYRKNRKRITVDVHSSVFYRLLSLWYDSDDDNRKYILVGYKYRPLEDTYSMEFWEYDNAEQINFNT